MVCKDHLLPTALVSDICTVNYNFRNYEDSFLSL